MASVSSDSCKVPGTLLDELFLASGMPLMARLAYISGGVLRFRHSPLRSLNPLDPLHLSKWVLFQSNYLLPMLISFDVIQLSRL